jgi:hypothetical protein
VKRGTPLFLLLLAAMVWFIAVGFWTGYSVATKTWEKSAAAHGKAEYYLDGNEAKWRWKP